MNTTTTSATEMLIARMRAYNGDFDGYPTMTESDIGLIDAANAESNTDKNGQPMPDDMRANTLVTLAYLASDITDSKTAYCNARDYINDYVANVITCNMIEGDNPFYTN